MDQQIKVGFDPREYLEALDEMAKETKAFSKQVEDSLGKDAAKQVKKFEETTEQSTNRIGNFFRNLSKRVKEDLKTAFDLGAIASGLNFAKDMGAGIKSVFDMEKAFDRLNTRLGFTNAQMIEFKKNLGRAVANTGQRLEDVLPGVESLAARGNIKDPGQLTAISKLLGQAKAVTGEDVTGLSESMAEILKNSGKEINATNLKDLMDTIEGTRVTGAFKTAGEAATAIEQISPYAQKMKMSGREMGALASVASAAGSGGQNILAQLMEQGTTIGGQEKLNHVFGVNLFKDGKLDAGALGKIDKNRFGQYSQQVLQEATGLHGANGADLSRFIDAFKGGMGQFDQVIKGSDETASQFKTASDNLSTQVDMFREKTKEATREIFGDASRALNQAMHGDFKGAGSSLMSAAQSAHENAGTLTAAAGLTAIVGTVVGGSAKSIFDKIGGVVGGGKGVQHVWVDNAEQIRTGAGASSIFDRPGVPGAPGAGGLMGKVGGAAMNTLKVAGAGVAGYEVGTAIYDNDFLGVKSGSNALTDKIYDWLHPDELKADSPATAMSPESIKKAIVDGVVEGHMKAKSATPVIMTHNSQLAPRGG